MPAMTEQRPLFGSTRARLHKEMDTLRVLHGLDVKDADYLAENMLAHHGLPQHLDAIHELARKVLATGTDR